MSLTFATTRTAAHRPWDASRTHAPRYWTPAQIDVLVSHYGEWSNDRIGQEIGRTAVAVAVKAKRLHLGVRDAFLTARQVADILAVDSHTPCRWAAKGLLPMERTDIVTAHGTAVMWACSVETLERFLARHPEAYTWRRIADEPWREMGKRAHQRADFLRIEQAAQILGVSVGMVEQHARKGWLPATRGVRVDRGGRGVWLIRRRDLAQFRARNPGAVGHPGYNRRRAA